MRHRTVRAIPALVSVLVAGIALAGCTTAAATGAASARPAPASPASRAAAPATRASTAFNGPFGPDSACVAALKAEQALQVRQGKDSGSETALDRDFTNFASALNAAAQEEKHAATAKAMTALAGDYTALVQSQSGAGQLPDMSTVQDDGTAFDKACSAS
jgi:hypothetical protein